MAGKTIETPPKNSDKKSQQKSDIIKDIEWMLHTTLERIEKEADGHISPQVKTELISQTISFIRGNLGNYDRNHSGDIEKERPKNPESYRDKVLDGFRSELDRLAFDAETHLFHLLDEYIRQKKVNLPLDSGHFVEAGNISRTSKPVILPLKDFEKREKVEQAVLIQSFEWNEHDVNEWLNRYGKLPFEIHPDYRQKVNQPLRSEDGKSMIKPELPAGQGFIYIDIDKNNAQRLVMFREAIRTLSSFEGSALSMGDKERVIAETKELAKTLEDIIKRIDSLKRQNPDLTKSYPQLDTILKTQTELLQDLKDFEKLDPASIHNAIIRTNQRIETINRGYGELEEQHGYKTITDAIDNYDHMNEQQKAEVREMLKKLKEAMFPDGWVDTAVKEYSGTQELHPAQRLLLSPANGVEFFVRSWVDLFSGNTASKDSISALTNTINSDPKTKARFDKGMKIIIENMNEVEAASWGITLVVILFLSMYGMKKVIGFVPQSAGRIISVANSIRFLSSSLKIGGKIADTAVLVGEAGILKERLPYLLKDMKKF